jgi:hypothetical protein
MRREIAVVLHPGFQFLEVAGPTAAFEITSAFGREATRCANADLTEIGIPRCYLARMCNDALLVNVGYGLYCAAAQGCSGKQWQPDLGAAAHLFSRINRA